MTAKTRVCPVSDVPPGGMKECSTQDGSKVLVLNCADGYLACEGLCPHQGTPLCDGFYDGEVLTCNQHLWQWDVRTGAPLGSAEKPLLCYPVTVEDGHIYIVPSKPAPSG